MGDRGVDTGNARDNGTMSHVDDYGDRAYRNYRVMDDIDRMLYERRLSLGMSQALVATKTGVDQSFIEDYELGEEYPSLVWIFSYAGALGLGLKIGLKDVDCVDSAVMFSRMLHDYRVGKSITVNELAQRMNSNFIDVLMIESGVNDDQDGVLLGVPLSFMADYALEAGSSLVIECKVDE